MMRVISLLFHDVYIEDPGESGFSSDAADRYKLSLRDFDSQLAGLAATRADGPLMFTVETGGLKLSGYREFGIVPYAFTVDDGGVSYYTIVADRLEARGWRGHCFVSTNAIGTRGFLTAAQIRELDARGHLIGTHSATHPARMSACDVEEIRDEWTRSRHALEDILCHRVEAASVPGGYYSRRVAATARDAGLRVLFTSEPTTIAHDASGILVIGRFTLRRLHAPDTASRFVGPEPWTRYREWARWNAKGLLKPLLGPAYAYAADWFLRGTSRSPADPKGPALLMPPKNP
jgi:peptidoglycan/xylan/chitin deacetylase (PgdA/CDA1 family)